MIIPIPFTITIIIIILILFILNVLYKTYYTTKIKLSEINLNNYDSKKKTCILISGQIRENYYSTLISHKLFLYDPLKVDIFAVFSDDIRDEHKQIVTNILKPKSILWVKDNKDLYKTKEHINWFLMFDKMYICNNLKNEYQQKHNITYDINIRIRPDLYIKNYIPEHIVNNLKQNTIYSPRLFNWDFFTTIFYLGITDQIFITDNNTMNIVSDICTYAYSNYIHTIFIEKFLKDYLITKKINIQKINIGFVISKINADNNSIFSILMYYINYSYKTILSKIIDKKLHKH